MVLAVSTSSTVKSSGPMMQWGSATGDVCMVSESTLSDAKRLSSVPSPRWSTVNILRYHYIYIGLRLNVNH